MSYVIGRGVVDGWWDKANNRKGNGGWSAVPKCFLVSRALRLSVRNACFAGNTRNTWLRNARATKRNLVTRTKKRLCHFAQL